MQRLPRENVDNSDNRLGEKIVWTKAANTHFKLGCNSYTVQSTKTTLFTIIISVLPVQG